MAGRINAEIYARQLFWKISEKCLGSQWNET